MRHIGLPDRTRHAHILIEFRPPGGEEATLKILATFDGTPYSEAIIATLNQIAGLPGAEFTLLAIAHEPGGKLRRRGRTLPIVAGDIMGRSNGVMVDRTDPTWAENKGQAIERKIAEKEGYLAEIAGKLPSGIKCSIEAHVSDNVGQTIIERAREEQVDVIVMATRSRSGINHALFGSTAEDVVRSGVAPVLLVHPKD
jgi:nucleotide-binding universal stress UspA family protein